MVEVATVVSISAVLNFLSGMWDSLSQNDCFGETQQYNTSNSRLEASLGIDFVSLDVIRCLSPGREDDVPDGTQPRRPVTSRSPGLRDRGQGGEQQQQRGGGAQRDAQQHRQRCRVHARYLLTNFEFTSLEENSICVKSFCR